MIMLINILHLVASVACLAGLGRSQCPNPCGQICCASNEFCATEGNCVIATSSSQSTCSASCGIWQAVTETHIEVRKKMIIYNTFIPTGCLSPVPQQIATVTITTTALLYVISLKNNRRSNATDSLRDPLQNQFA